METLAKAAVGNGDAVRVGNWVYRNHNCRHSLIDGEMWFCLGDVKSILHMTSLIPDALPNDQVRYITMDDWGRKYPGTAMVNWDGIDTLLDFAFEEIAEPFRRFLTSVENIARSEHEFFVANGIED